MVILIVNNGYGTIRMHQNMNMLRVSGMKSSIQTMAIAARVHGERGTTEEFCRL